jgi:hypothetical protein
VWKEFDCRTVVLELLLQLQRGFTLPWLQVVRKNDLSNNNCVYVSRHRGYQVVFAVLTRRYQPVATRQNLWSQDYFSQIVPLAVVANEKSERFYANQLGRLLDRQILRLSFSADCPRVSGLAGVLLKFHSNFTKMSVSEILGKRSGALDAPAARVQASVETPGFKQQTQAQVHANSKIIHAFSSRENCTKLVVGFLCGDGLC